MTRRIWTPAVASALLAVLSAPAAATVDTIVKGSVRDELLVPVVGATVGLYDRHGKLLRESTTATDGTFSFFGIPFGEYELRAKAQGRTESKQRVQASSSSTSEVELFCVADNAVSVIVEQREVAPPSRAVGSISTLGRETLKSLPKGEDRPITEVVTTQPGFVQDAFGNVYSRGNHSNIQYQIDGIPIPDSVGNLFAQSLPVRLIDSLEVITGGMPAEFGNRLAAVVNVNTRRGTNSLDGLVQLRYGSFQTIESSGYLSWGSGPFSFFVGGSFMQSQRVLDPPSITPILHDDGHNARLFARLDYAPTSQDRIELFVNYAKNRFEIPIDPTVVPLDPMRPDLVRPVDSFGNESPAYVPHDTDATETEHELFLTLSWLHSFGKRGQLQIAPYYKMSFGALASDPAHALGALADPGSIVSDVTRRADHGGAVIHYAVQVGNHLIKTGVQLNYLRGATDYTQYVRDDGSGSGGVASSEGGTDRTSALLSGVYLQDRWESGQVRIQYGVRFDLQHVMLADGTTSDQWGISPRLGASLAFLKDLVGRVFVGVLFQPPPPLDLGNAARVLGVISPTESVPYDIKAETALYGELGLSARILKKVKLSVTGWGKYSFHQFDNIALGATNLIGSYNFEHGRSVGVELAADIVFRDWLSGFANATWLIAQGQGISSAKFLFAPDQLADTSWQTLDHAQTWTANAGLTVQYSGASVTAMATYGSGLRTGPSNDQTVPQHIRFDMTLQYSFEKLPLRPRLAIDIINLFDSHYAYRIGNAFVGSSYAAPRSVFARLAIPLDLGGTP